MDRGRDRDDDRQRMHSLMHGPGERARAGDFDADKDFPIPTASDPVPTSSETDSAHFRRFTTRTLQDLATIIAEQTNLFTKFVEWREHADQRDKTIAGRLIDPKQLAAHAAAGAKQGAETALASLQQEQASEQAVRKALLQRLDDDHQARQVVLGRQRLHAYIIAAIGMAFVPLALGAGWMGYAKGRDSGYNAAYAEAHDEKAAVDWANTPNGRTARQMARLNPDLMSMLYKCSGPGWTRKSQQGRDACFPGSGTGWWVP